MPFNVHPIFLIWLIYLLLLVGAAYVIAWAARKGWEAGGPPELADRQVAESSSGPFLRFGSAE
jgi:amino acid transporter